MPFEDTILRDSLERRARKARRHGERRDESAGVQRTDTARLVVREQAIFHDQTGEEIMGWMTT